MNTMGAFLSPEAERYGMQCDCFSTKFNLPQCKYCRHKEKATQVAFLKFVCFPIMANFHILPKNCY